MRDLLLGREPKDYDVATGALPHQVQQYFPGSPAVGAKFGVILVREGEAEVEVATFRTEQDYRDGRRPENVRFTASFDSLRRGAQRDLRLSTPSRVTHPLAMRSNQVKRTSRRTTSIPNCIGPIRENGTVWASLRPRWRHVDTRGAPLTTTLCIQ